MGIQLKTSEILTKQDASGVLYPSMVLERRGLSVKEEKRQNNALLFALYGKEIACVIWKSKSLGVLKELMYQSFQYNISVNPMHG